MGISAAAGGAGPKTTASKKRSKGKMLGGKLAEPQLRPILVVDDQDQSGVASLKSKKTKAKDREEKRLKRVRAKAPAAWLSRLERAVSQRMFLIDRQRVEVNGVPQETFELAGSTGNVYSVTINHVPSCTCQDYIKGNICKHIIYVIHLVLKAPPGLEYQAALLTSELKEIFDRSPVPQPDSDHQQSDSTRRKAIEGDCPICFMEFNQANEEIVWCKAACGNNIHKECFEKWAKNNGSKEVRCVYCRTTWKGDEMSVERIREAKESRSANSEGYVNVASELGISTYRETSSYHRYWVNQQYERGHSFDTR